MFTRRDLIRCCASLLGSTCVPVAAVEHSRSAAPGLSPALDLEHSVLLAVSPDGTKLCIYDTREAYQTFLWPDAWRRKDPRGSPSELRVLEIDTGRIVYRGRFKSPVHFASFFSSSQALFLQTSGFPVRQFVVVDLNTGVCAERIVTETIDWSRVLYATGDRMLLRRDMRKKYSTEELVQLALPEYRELARAAFATRPREAELKFETELYFSSDRKTVAYSFEDVVVSRRTEDLGILWTRRITPRLAGAWRLAVSMDGSLVAAAVADKELPHLEYYTTVFDGNSGAELARLPVCGAYGMAISADSKLLAVGARLSGGAELAVHIYDLRSALLIASLKHAETPKVRHQFLYSFFDTPGIEFTSDGKYLVTSGGLRTKVWRLAGAL